jgi:hypothetical protein
MSLLTRSATHADSARHSRRRWVLVAGAVLAVWLVAALFWLGWRASQAQHAMSHASDRLARAQIDLLNGDSTALAADVVAIRAATSDAKVKSNGWLFRVAADVPYFGRTPRSVRSLASAADELAHQPLQSMFEVSTTLSPNTVRGANGAIDITSLSRSATTLDDVARQLGDVRRRLLHASHGAWVLNPMDHARSTTLRTLERVDNQVTVAARFARIGPAMLGAQTTRHYLVVAQHNNQARGTGGVADAYTTVSVRRGKAVVTKTAAVASLRNAKAWTTANLSPDFPTAAARWRTLFEQATGQRVDGVIGVDAVTFEHILAATGPLQINGRTAATRSTVVSEAEVQYASIKRARLRTVVLAGLAKGVLGDAFAGKGNATVLATQLGAAGTEGHLRIWSARSSEQAVLSQTSFAGALTAAAVPFAEVVVNNTSGARLDTFLQRSVGYLAGACGASTRQSTITIRLTNAVPAQVPPFLTEHTDRVPAGTAPEQMRLSVRVYTSVGSTLTSATLDSNAITMKRTADRGHPVFVTTVAINPVSTRTLSLQLSERTLPGAPVVPAQPLVHPQDTSIGAQACSPR